MYVVKTGDTLYHIGRLFGVSPNAIIQANGQPVIIDINAWPSYALYRERATRAIADHLAQRFVRQPRVLAAMRS